MKLQRVEEDGLVGVLASADLAKSPPRVIVFGGSDGGIPEQLAIAVAAEGVTCFGLAYFGAKGLPHNLVEVPLEYVEGAMSWFRQHQETAGGRIGAVGVSKGAELALLTAAMFPRHIGAVAAFAPSSVVFAGINRFGGRSERSSWSHEGRPLPFVPYRRGVRAAVSLRGMSVAPIYAAALDNVDAVRDAAIQVERIDGPIVLVSGDDDRMWPATRMAQMITTRLADHGQAESVTHLRSEGAGHLLSRHARSAVTKRRIRSRMIDFGGTAAADAAAGDDAWPKSVKLLMATLA